MSPRKKAIKETPAAKKEKPKKGKPKKAAGMLEVKIPKVRVERFSVNVVGLPGSLLVPHAWSKYNVAEILRKHMQLIVRDKKLPRNPHQEFSDSLYWISPKPTVKPIVPPELKEDEPLTADHIYDLVQPPAYLTKAVAKGTFGIPAPAFAKGMISAVRQVDEMTMAATKGLFYVIGDADRGNLVIVKSKKPPEMRMDIVKIDKGNTADPRFRAAFETWSAKFVVEFNPSLIRVEQIVNLLNLAGFHVGILENRPEKGGQWGRYKVV